MTTKIASFMDTKKIIRYIEKNFDGNFHYLYEKTRTNQDL